MTGKSTNPNDYVSVKEAAEKLKMAPSTLYKKVERGSIPEWAIAPRRPGEAVRISRAYLTPKTDNITAFPTELSEATIQRIADAVARRISAGFREVAS